jgi:transcriptional regulator with XRE-family HTH domain
MGKSTAPALNSEAIHKARLAGFMTQLEVAQQVTSQLARDGIKFDRSSLSLIESGTVKRPHPKVVRALAQVLGLEAGEIYADEDDDAEPDVAA